MHCDLCQAIQSGADPALRNQFNPACLHCGARQIQYIQRVLQIGREAKAQRCREALSRSMEFGHAETEIRRLAKLAAWAAGSVSKKE